jgi:hypothetical protein
MKRLIAFILVFTLVFSFTTITKADDVLDTDTPVYASYYGSCFNSFYTTNSIARDASNGTTTYRWRTRLDVDVDELYLLVGSGTAKIKIQPVNANNVVMGPATAWSSCTEKQITLTRVTYEHIKLKVSNNSGNNTQVYSEGSWMGYYYSL